MSYGLNVEMHKQTEIAKRLGALISQLMPFLATEHQQQVAQAVERAKQVTVPELNAIIGVRIFLKFINNKIKQLLTFYQFYFIISYFKLYFNFL